MEFTGTHVRQRILQSIVAAVEAVPNIGSTATASSEVETPQQGAIADISLLKETIVRKGAVSGRGVLSRSLLIAVVVSAPVPLDYTVEAFEGLVGDVERALCSNEALSGIADDWYLSDTEWSYDQAEETSIVSVAMAYVVTYSTSTAEPGRSI